VVLPEYTASTGVPPEQPEEQSNGIGVSVDEHDPLPVEPRVIVHSGT
jgi:hypothetical protein